MPRKKIKNFLVPKLTSPWISSIASGLFGYGIPIFMLHRTYPDNTSNHKQTPSYLRQCLTYLKRNGYHFVSVADIVQSAIHKTSLPNKSIAFTIDDGFIDQASLAAPVFIEFQCPVTIFLISDFLDGKLWPWFSQVQYLIQTTETRFINFNIGRNNVTYSLTNDQQKRAAYHDILEMIKHINWCELNSILMHLSETTNVAIPKEPPDHYKPMSWSQAQDLENEGITFGPHSVTHPILSKISNEESITEITHSWERLKQKLQNPVPIFCYPNGDPLDYGQREIEILKKTDMIGAVSTIPRQFRTEANIVDIAYNLPRYSLPDNYTDFLMYCSWIEFTKERLRNN